MSQVRRRRLVGLAIVLVSVVLGGLAALLAVNGGLGGDEPPATGAADLVPRETLVYVHLSTDAGRPAVDRARELTERFGAYDRYRDQILQRLTGTGERVTAKDVEPWLGDEAALALVDAGGTTAGSLVVVAVTDEERAREFLERNPRRSAMRRYKGDRIDEYGSVAVAFKDGYLLIGQDRTVQGALDRANGRGDSLADDPVYKRAAKGLPEGRAAEAYASAAGLRRLLAPQGEVLGTLAALLDQPGLQGVSLTAQAEDGALRIRARSALDAKARRAAKAFQPQLLAEVPEDAMAYLGVRGISGSLGRLLTATAGGANAGGAGPLLQRLRRELGRETGGALERDLLELLDGEVAVVVTRATPAPLLSLVTRVEDEDATASVLRRLRRPLVRLLTPEGEQAPAWRDEHLGDGVRAATLALPTGAQLTWAVFDGKLVFSTGPDGVRRIEDADGSLGDSSLLKRVTADRPESVTSLGFLDFSQLLELGEQTGLNDSRAYLTAREDLQKVRAVGVSSYGDEEETTAEILLSIP